MLADLRWLGLEWDEGPDKDGEVRKKTRYLSTTWQCCHGASV